VDPLKGAQLFFKVSESLSISYPFLRFSKNFERVLAAPVLKACLLAKRIDQKQWC